MCNENKSYLSNFEFVKKILLFLHRFFNQIDSSRCDGLIFVKNLLRGLKKSANQTIRNDVYIKPKKNKKKVFASLLYVIIAFQTFHPSYCLFAITFIYIFGREEEEKDEIRKKKLTPHSSALARYLFFYLSFSFSHTFSFFFVSLLIPSILINTSRRFQHR